MNNICRNAEERETFVSVSVSLLSLCTCAEIYYQMIDLSPLFAAFLLCVVYYIETFL